MSNWSRNDRMKKLHFARGVFGESLQFVLILCRRRCDRLERLSFFSCWFWLRLFFSKVHVNLIDYLNADSLLSPAVRNNNVGCKWLFTIMGTRSKLLRNLHLRIKVNFLLKTSYHLTRKQERNFLFSADEVHLLLVRFLTWIIQNHLFSVFVRIRSTIQIFCMTDPTHTKSGIGGIR